MTNLSREHAGPGIRLVVLAFGLAIAGVVGAPGSDAQVVPGSGTRASVDPQRRGFQHPTHEAVTCGVCHTEDDRHRGSRTWTPADCAACHHAEATAVGCDACHERTDLATPRWSSTVMALSVWDGTRARVLAFDHDRHAEVLCVSCHGSGASLPPQSCSSCHESHHQPASECARCHEAPAPTAHDLAAHGSCGGAGCHTVDATPSTLLSRSSCELCHTEQRDHYPDRSCAACHMMPGTSGGE